MVKKTHLDESLYSAAEIRALLYETNELDQQDSDIEIDRPGNRGIRLAGVGNVFIIILHIVLYSISSLPSTFFSL